jgi:hypothetical protein
MADVTTLLTGLRPGTPPAVPFDMDAARKAAVKPAKPDESSAAAGAETETHPT